MSSISTNGQLSFKLNPDAAVFVPRELVKYVDKKIEFTLDEMLARWADLSGYSHHAVNDPEEWMAAVMDREAQTANYQLEQSAFALLLKEANRPAIKASRLIQGVQIAEIGAKGFNKLPGELRNNIFKLALTAENGIISMPCLSDKTFKPNVAVALLRTCKQVYIEARNFLYTANTIIFDNFGSDIKDIAKFAYPKDVQGPIFANVVLDIGHMAIDYEGFFKTQSLVNALKGMRNPITVENLVLEFRSFCFNEAVKPEDLAIGLSNIKVSKSLTMCGAGYHWDEGDMFAVPRTLGMAIDSVQTNFCPGNEALVDPRHGFFIVKYKPVAVSGEHTGVDEEVPDDVGVQYDGGCETIYS